MLISTKVLDISPRRLKDGLSRAGWCCLSLWQNRRPTTILCTATGSLARKNSVAKGEENFDYGG